MAFPFAGSVAANFRNPLPEPVGLIHPVSEQLAAIEFVNLLTLSQYRLSFP
jgi:hypothetical protein